MAAHSPDNLNTYAMTKQHFIALETLAQDGWGVSKVEASAEGIAYLKAEKPSAYDEVRRQLARSLAEIRPQVVRPYQPAVIKKG